VHGPHDVSQAKIDACSAVLDRGGTKDEIAHAYANRGMLYWATGRIREATADLDAAIAASPDRSELYLNRGAFRAQIGDYGHAEQDYQKALALDPANSGAMNNLARVQIVRGDYAAGLAWIDRAIVIKSDLDVFHDTRAHALMGLGRIGAAAEAFDRAIAVGGPARAIRYQRQLVVKGYDPGRFDGVMDDATWAALKNCIRDNCRLMLE
jgi:tetratricopeptide (TPR) repeat protein